MGHWNQVLQGHPGDSADEFTMSQAVLFNAPAIAFLTMHSGAPQWSTYDKGASGQSLMPAAKERGVDSMAACGFVKYPWEIRRIISIPDDGAIVMGTGPGCADGQKINGFRSDRESLENVLQIFSCQNDCRERTGTGLMPVRGRGESWPARHRRQSRRERPS